MSFAATWINLEIIILSEVRQTQIYIDYIQNIKKMIQMNLFTKQTQTHRLREQTMATGGKGWGGRGRMGVCD